jgi:hypothetical protein
MAPMQMEPECRWISCPRLPNNITMTIMMMMVMGTIMSTSITMIMRIDQQLIIEAMPP